MYQEQSPKLEYANKHTAVIEPYIERATVLGGSFVLQKHCFLGYHVKRFAVLAVKVYAYENYNITVVIDFMERWYNGKYH